MNARIDTLHATAPTTPLPLSAEQQIGQIAVQLPGATAVFRRLKLDFCCGGQVSLAKAAADKGLDADAVLAELAALQRSDAVPEAASPSALIDHILARYHEVHRQQLPELIRMARRVEAVHRDHPQVPAGLADHLEQQLAKDGLFPRRVEGRADANWLVIDYQSVIVHLFKPDARAYYRLERLWDDGRNRMELPNEELLEA